jgi:hypothetical protein
MTMTELPVWFEVPDGTVKQRCFPDDAATT